MALQRLNIEQKRAKAAFEYAKAAENSKNYGSYAKKMPMHILNNGLANALAFAYSKSDWEQLYLDIEDWLLSDPQNLITEKLNDQKKVIAERINKIVAEKEIKKTLSDKEKKDIADKENKKALIETILGLNDSELRQVTNEVLALFSWLRRFVKED